MRASKDSYWTVERIAFHAPQMIYPLVRELAATGARVRVPVAVTCRLLGFSEQAYYQWLKA